MGKDTIKILIEENISIVLKINNLRELIDYVKQESSKNPNLYKFPVTTLVSFNTFCSYLRESKEIYPEIVLSDQKDWSFLVNCVKNPISLKIEKT